MEFADDIGLDGHDERDDVVLRIEIHHDEPLETADVSAVLESLSVVHDLELHEGEHSYFDEVAQVWRMYPSTETGLSPKILRIDANFIIEIATAALVVSAIGVAVSAASLVYQRQAEKREARNEAAEAGRGGAAGQVADDTAAAIGQLIGSLHVEGDVHITVIQAS